MCGHICDTYAQQDSRIKVIHKENGGLSDARNAGLHIARGEYIAFVDSDDWVAPKYLEQLYESLSENDADIVECDIIRTADKFIDLPAAEHYTKTIYGVAEALQELISDGAFHQYVWNKLYKKEVIAGITFPKGKINEDEFWTYKVFGNAKKVIRIHSPLYYYFQRSSSIMGIGFTLKRLDSIEAKCQRQEYIYQKFPQLASFAKVNLHQSVMYCGQMIILYISSQDQDKARNVISECLSKYPLTQKDISFLPFSKSIWLRLASISFWNTCRLRNFLKRCKFRPVSHTCPLI